MSELSFGAALFVSLLAAAIPTALYALLVWRLDYYEREPLELLLAAFAWGAIPAAIGAAIVGGFLSIPLEALPERYYSIASASLIAPPVEELVKGLALAGLYLLARQEFDDVLDGIVYGSLVGFGFAMSENVLYFMSNRGSLSEWATVVFGRAIAFGFNHAMFTSFTGVGFGLARGISSRRRRYLTIGLGLLAAMTAHFMHNFLLSTGDVCLPSLLIDWAGVAVIFVIVILSWWRQRRWIKEELASEVETGVLSKQQFEDIRSRRKRLKRTWKAMGASGIRLARLWRQLTDQAVELAFQKHRAAVAPSSRQTQRISELRHKILQLRLLVGDESAIGLAACPGCGRPLDVALLSCPYCRSPR